MQYTVVFTSVHLYPNYSNAVYCGFYDCISYTPIFPMQYTFVFTAVHHLPQLPQFSILVFLMGTIYPNYPIAVYCVSAGHHLPQLPRMQHTVFLMGIIYSNYSNVVNCDSAGHHLPQVIQCSTLWFCWAPFTPITSM